MSYRREKGLYRAQGADLDALIAKGKEYLAKATPALEAAQKVLEDPYFPKVTQQILELNRLEQPTKPGAPPKKGVGLDKASKGLSAYIYVRKNKWVVPAAIAVILGVPFFLGFGVGKRSRR